MVVFVSSRWRKLKWFLAMLWILQGCAAFSPGRGPDPEVLVIRNRSGRDIKTATLSAAGAGAGWRYGSISPVPRGASQTYVRPDSAPRLPAHLRLAWETAGEGAFSREVSLTRLPEAPHSDPESGGLEALVFEIRPDDAVDVYRDTYSP